MNPAPPFHVVCPVPLADHPRVLLAHGGGGRLMHQLIATIFHAAFDNPVLRQRHDGAVLDSPGDRLAFTTDSYVIQPLFFPGGDIGTLAVNGTVNDLAMCGARPLWLSCGFILEEGLPMETLWKVACSMRRAADAAGVSLVTGDTKVVDRGKGDGLYVNTAGIGVLAHSHSIAPQSVRPGDAVVLSNDVGRHGTAILSVREGLAFESPIVSDCAPLAEPVAALLDAGIDVHCLRDLTRGGLAAGVHEIAATSGHPMRIEEERVPVGEAVRGACELLGLDPLHVANEGCFLAFVPADQARACREVLRTQAACRHAEVIGEVLPGGEPRVVVRNRLGSERLLDLPSGEQLPRIC